MWGEPSGNGAGGRAWKGGTSGRPSQRRDLCYYPENRAGNGKAFELGEVGLCLHFREQFPREARLQGLVEGQRLGTFVTP